MGRIYGKIIENKIETSLQNKIGEEHVGFTVGKSCKDDIYTLQQFMEKERTKHKTTQTRICRPKKSIRYGNAY